MDSVFDWVARYGYAGLFGLLMLGIVGLPVPDETLLVFSGYLIASGRLRPVGAFLAAWGGSACGISLSYAIGRIFGASVVVRYGKYVRLTERRLAAVHEWFIRAGDWLLAAGYFIPGVRHFTAVVAGLSKLEYRRFALFAYGGAAVWVATFLSIGYFFGEHWRAVMEGVRRYTWLCVIALAFAAALWLLARRRRE